MRQEVYEKLASELMQKKADERRKFWIPLAIAASLGVCGLVKATT